MNFLACDLGGTKVLMGIYKRESNSEIPKLIYKEKYSSAEWQSFDSILEDFIYKKYKDIDKINTACFALAGPIKHNSCKLTNLPWNISGKEIKDKYNFDKVELINDFAVLIYGISFLKKNQFEIIQKGHNFDESSKSLHAIVGAGTGLGISRGLINSNDIKILPSEGGHIEFSPKTSEEWELKIWLKEFLNKERISCERVISGVGLCNIAKWRFSKPDTKNHFFQKTLNLSTKSSIINKNLASEVCKLSENGDPLFIEIENMWLSAYASFLGDVALHELCFGGLWISGGTAPKHFKNFRSDSFLKHFSNKGRYKDILKSIPVKVILDEEFGLYSAACRAKMLLKTT